MTSTLHADVPEIELDGAATGTLGDRGTRLLAGPSHGESESLASHERRLGRLADCGLDPGGLREVVRESGLTGRGGGGFPLAGKLESAARAGGSPLVVVNASEGEPASRKDRSLLAHRPHLVLDGAVAAALAVGASDVVVYLHRSRERSTRAVLDALASRTSDPVTFRVVDAPARYVAGETSAVVSYLEGAGALPRRRGVPVSVRGVRGRPTVVSNTETLAHLALIARFGAAWFRECGDAASPGSTLVTLSGAVARPGTVVEVSGHTTIGATLARHGAVDAAAAVLVGGYAGTWLTPGAASDLTLSRSALGAAGAPLGCGLLAVLPEGACGLRTTARLVRWLAGQSAGQCGPCVLGLPRLATLLEDLSVGEGGGRKVRQLHQVAGSITGRGACGHPSGVAGLVQSALVAFAGDLERHRRGRPCSGATARFPLPGAPTESR